MDLDVHAPLPRRRDFRIGIVGSGFIVNDCHLVAYRKAGFNPVAIASRNYENADRVAQRHGIPKIFVTYDQLLDDSSIEVLDIAVPPNAQLDLIKAACKRKTVKGILAQKPLGMNYTEAVEAVRACEAAGITLAVNQNMRYDQSVRAGKTLLEKGVLGEPVFATIEMRAIPHWMPWQKDLGWLTLRIMSIHHLDTFRYWFGDPEGIYCSIRTDPRTKFPHTDGICTYILEYGNGLRCVGIDDTWAGPAKEGCPSDNYIRWRIEGTDGLAIGGIGWCKDPFTSPSTIRYASKGDKAFHEPRWTESWFPDAFIGTMAQLLIALENGTEPEISGRDNLKTMALVAAAYRSEEQQRLIHFAAIDGEAEGESVSRVAEFTPRAQQVLGFARKEADRLNHAYVGTEHLLLGLIRLGSGVAVNVLLGLGMDIEATRKEVLNHVASGPAQKTFGNIPYTAPLKRTLAFAAKEAHQMDHTYVGTEHVLLGLLRLEEGIASKVFEAFKINRERTRREIMREIAPHRVEPPDEKEPLALPYVNATELGIQPEWRDAFTPQAMQCLALARKEADRFNHNFVGTEHLLLALINLGQGVAFIVVKKMGLELPTLRMEIEKQIGTGPDQNIIGNIPYTPRVKKVLTLAAKEAEALNHTYVGTEHILLGLLREGDGVAARVLASLDVYVDETRQEILKELDPNSSDQR